MKKNGLLSNLSWKFAERMCAQIVTLVVSIVLARILTPEDYGIISIVTIFITFANVFVSDGFGSALIQKKTVDAMDYSSVLYFNMAFSIVLYIILFVSAPFISSFYGKGYEILTPVIRVLGLRIILSGINSIQQAYVSRKMIFKKFFLSTWSATVLSAVVGIYMAYSGYGIWALVGQYLTNTTISTIVLAITLRKKPLLAFSFSRVKSMLGFGSRILGTRLLITGFEEIRALIVGKVYSSEDLAFYDKGKQFPHLVVNNVNTSIGAVLFPKMAQQQEELVKIKATMRKSIRFSSYFMCPLMLGLAAVAKPFVVVVLTSKWLPCVRLLQLFCVFYLFQPIHTANMQAIKAIGRGDIYFKLEVIKKILELGALLAFMWISVDAIVISMAIMSTLFVFLNAFPNQRLLGYSIIAQLKDILPSILMSLIMAICVYSFGFVPLNPILSLILQVFVGAIIYILLSFITKNKEMQYLINLLKRKM